MFWIRRLVAAAVILAGAQTGAGCGTDAVGTDACRRIEQARCRRAPQCPDLLLQSNGVEECTQFARDRCLHGWAIPDPGAPVVESCIAAIERATCDGVAAPETTPECAFLKPIPTPDAGSTGEGAAASDASTDLDSSTAQPD